MTPERVDMLTAGWPCQDLSVAGKRKGLAGERSGLFWEVCRVADAVRPEWLLLENVPGLLSSHGGQDFWEVLNALDNLRFDVEYRVLDAQHFGVPQRRRRVFVVGHHRDWPRPGTVLLEPQGRAGNPTEVRRAGQDVVGTIAVSTRSDGLGTDEAAGWQLISQPLRSHSHPNSNTPGFMGENEPLVTAPIRAEYAKSANDIWQSDSLISQPLTGGPYADAIGEEGKLIPTLDHDMQAGQFLDADGMIVSMRGREGGNMPEASEVCPALRGAEGGSTRPMVAGVHANQRGEARLSELAGCLSGDRSGKQFEGVLAQGVRRLTPLECCRLQGLPDGWTDVGLSDTARYRLVGNAVAVPVIEWIGRRFPGLLTFGELFAGIGGFRLGLERAGHTCLWANELNADACKVRRAHWPDEVLFECDVRELCAQRRPPPSERGTQKGDVREMADEERVGDVEHVSIREVMEKAWPPEIASPEREKTDLEAAVGAAWSEVQDLVEMLPLDGVASTPSKRKLIDGQIGVAMDALRAARKALKGA